MTGDASTCCLHRLRDSYESMTTPHAVDARRLDPDAARGILLAAAVLVTLAAVAPLGAALSWAAASAWFVLPGVFIARALYGRQPGAWIGALLLGGPWGWGFSSLVLLACWVAGLRHWGILVLSPLARAAGRAGVRPLAGRLRLPHFTRGDVGGAAPAARRAARGRTPFARVGADLPDGRAYRAYFTADFIWRMAVVAEVSKGDVPPRNQFSAGDTLRYYWLPHLMTAVQHRGTRPPATLEQVLLVNSIVLDLVFVAFLYGLTRQLVSSRTAARWGCLGAILFTSFEGTERLWVVWQQGGNWDALRYLNIDSVSRWFYGSLPVDGLHRLLLYQPHHAMGYAAGLSAVLCAGQADDVGRPGLMVWLGSLLALSLLLSTFAALMLASMVAVYVGLRLVIGAAMAGHPGRRGRRCASTRGRRGRGVLARVRGSVGIAHRGRREPHGGDAHGAGARPELRPDARRRARRSLDRDAPRRPRTPTSSASSSACRCSSTSSWT
jgi:hypothetical protein